MKFLYTLLLGVSLISCSTYHNNMYYTKKEIRIPDPVYKSVAQIAVELEVGQAIGTAFAIRNINNNTYMVSVNHLCKRRGKKVVAFSVPDPGTGRKKFTGKVVYSSPENDFCIVRVYDTGEKFVPLRFASDPPRAGDRIFTIGSPSGAFPTKTDGYVVGHNLLGMMSEEP